MVNGLQKFQCRFDLRLRLTGFHCGAHDGNVLALSCHIVSIGDHAHVDVCKELKENESVESIQLTEHEVGSGSFY